VAVSLKKASIFHDGLDHPECVAVHPDGSVWAGGEAGQIYRISPDGQSCDEVTRTSGFHLGIAFAPDASWLVACDLKNKCLWRIDTKSGKVDLLARRAGAHVINIPNYPVFRRDGTLYVSESGGFRQVNGKVLRFTPDGEGDVWHDGPFNFANGMALAPDEGALFVACTWLPGVERIEIRPDGGAGKRSVYARFKKVLPDGLAFDRAGNLYVSCYIPARIYRISKRRQISILIDDWEAHTICNCTNMAFGGARFDQLLVANLGRWHITRISLGVRGAPLACHAALTPSPCTQGEGRGEGAFQELPITGCVSKNPLPTPLPEYRERERSRKGGGA
jgi:sugar lactone lactonase YvrE